MLVSVTEAKGQLTELVKRAVAGDEIILTRHGQQVARLTPIGAAPDATRRRAILDAARRSGSAKTTGGTISARSQNFLYGEDGMPG